MPFLKLTVFCSRSLTSLESAVELEGSMFYCGLSSYLSWSVVWKLFEPD